MGWTFLQSHSFEKQLSRFLSIGYIYIVNHKKSDNDDDDDEIHYFNVR